MMIAMMSPVLVPALARYRETLGGVRATRVGATRGGGTRLNAATTLAALGYFFVWTSLGAAVFPLGTLLAELAVRLPWFSRMVPLAVAAVVLIAGALQLTRWKARCLACCRDAARGGDARSSARGGDALSGARGDRALAGASRAWRYGVRLGLDCCRCCAGLTATLLVVGVMDLRMMAAVTAAIMAERLGSGGLRAARAVGAVLVAAGLVLVARAAGLV
jgi:predicted metal-binding membrane protein